KIAVGYGEFEVSQLLWGTHKIGDPRRNIAVVHQGFGALGNGRRCGTDAELIGGFGVWCRHLAPVAAPGCFCPVLPGHACILPERYRTRPGLSCLERSKSSRP